MAMPSISWIHKLLIIMWHVLLYTVKIRKSESIRVNICFFERMICYVLLCVLYHDFRLVLLCLYDVLICSESLKQCSHIPTRVYSQSFCRWLYIRMNASTPPYQCTSVGNLLLTLLTNHCWYKMHLNELLGSLLLTWFIFNPSMDN